MLIPHFVGDLPKRMQKLEQLLSHRSKLHMVGSSFGGLMATLFAIKHPSRVEKMILLAPAINLLDLSQHSNTVISVPVVVDHGNKDAVIPLAQVESVARKVFTRLSFHRVNDDHFLHHTFKTLDWVSLLA